MIQVVPRCYLTSNLSSAKHIEILSAEALHKLWYIKRKLKLGPPFLHQLIYEMYIWPKLEYASIDHSSHQLYLTNHLEAIQNLASCFTASSNFRETSINTLKKSLGFVPLNARRITP